MLISIGLILFGLTILIFGADYLVKGAGSLSKKAGISPLVVGLTVVAFGTSAPELVVNISAALQEKTDIAMGNILGSNIVNILLILGLAALITKLRAQKTTTWKEVPFSFLAILIVYFLVNDVRLGGASINQLTRGDGLVLIGFFAIFLYYIYGLSKQSTATTAQEGEEIPVYSYGVSSIYIICGLVGLFFGGKFFVQGASQIALELGLSEFLIGLTVVAVGTSLPELAASIMAARRGQADIAIGNVIGSNIFNVFWILGVTAIIHPIPLDKNANFDIGVALLSSFLVFLFLFLRNKHELTRVHGIIFIVLYIAYTTYLVMRG